MSRILKTNKSEKIKAIIEGDYVREIHIHRLICYNGATLRIRKMDNEQIYKVNIHISKDSEWLRKVFPSNRSISEGLKIEVLRMNNPKENVVEEIVDSFTLKSETISCMNDDDFDILLNELN